MNNSQPNIPMLDLSPQIEMLWNELNEAIQRVLRSGQFIMGPEVAAFEEEAAAYLGVKHAIGVNSGTDALIIGLRALGIGSGDEVITAPFSFFATAESISNVGATPIFVDIEEESMNINPELIEDAITENTKAIMPVHLFGRPASMGRIMEIAQKHNLKVIEDSAQSFGARYFANSDHCPCRNPQIKQDLDGKQTGSIGDVGAFSFYPTKNLGAFGDGGMITTDDDSVAELARMLQNHGSREKYHHEMLGYNSRLDEIQAAVLHVKLPFIDIWNQERKALAQSYQNLLKGDEKFILPRITRGHTFHQYTVRVKGGNDVRNRIVHQMRKKNISIGIHYPILQSEYFVSKLHEPLKTQQVVSTRVVEEVISLPVWEQLSTCPIVLEHIIKTFQSVSTKTLA